MTGWRLKAYACLARNVFETTSTAFILTALTEYEFFAAWKLTKKQKKNEKKTEGGRPQPEQPGTTGWKMLEYGGTFPGK